MANNASSAVQDYHKIRNAKSGYSEQAVKAARENAIKTLDALDNSVMHKSTAKFLKNQISSAGGVAPVHRGMGKTTALKSAAKSPLGIATAAAGLAGAGLIGYGIHKRRERRKEN